MVSPRFNTAMWAFLITTVSLCCFFPDPSMAANYTRLGIGHRLQDVTKDPPPSVLHAGECIEYIFPRRMEDLKWGYIPIVRVGAMEACMRAECQLEIRERGVALPNWVSDTWDQGADCFLKLGDAGGLFIMKGDPAEPELVATLHENEDLTVHQAKISVGYELYLEDLYVIEKDHWVEYGPNRFSRNPSLVLKRFVWTWFENDFGVDSTILTTIPANLKIPDNMELV